MTLFTLQSALRVPDHVVVRELEGEAVLLNLDTETYFGLDEVGTRMWQLLTTLPNAQAAYDALLAEYDVSPQTLADDLRALVQQLLDHGLLAVAEA
ncbi:MAG: PqqD family protein [Caldilineales bacterium]|nr:PqqD family protein [Caldilineales bacterium]